MAIGHAAERRRPAWLAQLTPDHRDRGARWHKPEATHADVTRSRSADRRVEFLGGRQLHPRSLLERPAQISVTRTAPLRGAGRAARRGWLNRLRALPLISVSYSPLPPRYPQLDPHLTSAACAWSYGPAPGARQARPCLQ